MASEGHLILIYARSHRRSNVRTSVGQINAFSGKVRSEICLTDELGSPILGSRLSVISPSVRRQHSTGQPTLTRRERVDNVKKRDYFTKYGERARQVLEALLEKYANQGILAIESMDILKVDPLDEIGTPVEIIKLFGGKSQYLAAIQEFETQLYSSAS